ncbi:unnamed protein product [Linum trigynum]|uniref:Uncharacterized protein n=1 Tax=Linum trigynum TaxID=586398 RepID=A0AAV2CKV1_9ROSI
MTLGGCQGEAKFHVVTMGDHPIVLGIDFMNNVRDVPFFFAKTISIIDGGKACAIPNGERRIPYPIKFFCHAGIKRCEEKGAHILSHDEDGDGRTLVGA